MRQIRKGSPNRQQITPRSARIPDLDSSSSSVSARAVGTDPHKSKKKSMTTHATASCVFGVVGPLNQSYSGGSGMGDMG